MSAGTLTLTNNSDAVTGAGTTFTSVLVAGDFIVAKVGGITYTLPVKTVGSDTQVVLVSKYPGPSLAGMAWQAVPRESQNQVTAELVAQTTAALRGLNYDKQNWQALFSDSGDITVMLPDGSTFSGPSWLKLSHIMDTLDMPALTTMAAQIHADAVQVAADTQITATNTATATQAAQTATTAAQSASQAAQTATTKASQASASAVTAKNEADRAATANPDNQLKKVNNLSDVANVPAARTNLGLDRISQYSNETLLRAPTTSTYLAVGGSDWGVYNSVSTTWKPLGIGQGGTGATSVAGALANLGLGEGSALPVGVPVPWPSATPPTGWIKCNGAPFTASEYPKLAQAYPSLKLPDLRGEFIRGWDDGRGVDSGRVVLTGQSQSVQQHTHDLAMAYSSESGYKDKLGAGPNSDRIPIKDMINVTTYNGSGGFYLKANDSTGAETRPRNLAFNYIVRAV